MLHVCCPCFSQFAWLHACCQRMPSFHTACHTCYSLNRGRDDCFTISTAHVTWHHSHKHIVTLPAFHGFSFSFIRLHEPERKRKQSLRLQCLIMFGELMSRCSCHRACHAMQCFAFLMLPLCCLFSHVFMLPLFAAMLPASATAMPAMLACMPTQAF